MIERIHMQIKIQKKQKVLYLIGNAVIIALIIFVAIIPGMRKLQTVKDINETIRANIGKQTSTYQHLITLSKEGKNLEEKMTFIDNLFLTQQRTLEYIQTIENLAQEQSLTLEITLSEPTTEERFTYSTINFNVKGSWAHVYTFIHNIENTGPITVLTTKNIQPTGTLTSADPQDTTAVIATLTGQVPFMQE